MVGNERGQHWEATYKSGDPSTLSWFEDEPAMSLDLFADLRVLPATPVVDVGGGTSHLVDRLIESGFTDVTVLDISTAALEVVRERIDNDPRVYLLNEDVLSWRPTRPYGVWHDRALFHFLTSTTERDRYVSTLRSALRDGGAVVIGAFAEDGPESCSGLPTARFSPEELLRALGPGLAPRRARRELHRTPASAVQPFTWLAGRFDAQSG